MAKVKKTEREKLQEKIDKLNEKLRKQNLIGFKIKNGNR